MSDRGPALVVALTLMLGLAALALALTRDHDQPSFGHDAIEGTVALVPPPEWLAHADVSEADRTRVVLRHFPDDLDQAVVAPSDAPNSVAFMVLVELRPWTEDLSYGESIEVGGRSGAYAPRTPFLDHVVLQVGDGRHTLKLSARTGTPSQPLVDLAGVIDLYRPLAEQELGPEWTLVTTKREAESEATYIFDAQERVSGAQVRVRANHGVDEASLHLDHQPFDQMKIEVRGRRALVTLNEGLQMASIRWMEEPGLAIDLLVTVPVGDPLAHAMDVAEALVPVDAEGWRAVQAEQEDGR